MRRKLTMAVIIVASVLLQSTVCQMISVASIKPNLLVIVTVAFGLMRGRRDGMLTGFFLGLLNDIFFNTVIGFNALIYLWVGYFSGNFYRIFYDDDIKTPLLLISICDIVYGVIQYGFLFLMRGRIQFFFYLGRVILPEMIYTLILTIVVYQVLYAINRRLVLTDKGGVDGIV